MRSESHNQASLKGGIIYFNCVFLDDMVSTKTYMILCFNYLGTFMRLLVDLTVCGHLIFSRMFTLKHFFSFSSPESVKKLYNWWFSRPYQTLQRKVSKRENSSQQRLIVETFLQHIINQSKLSLLMFQVQIFFFFFYQPWGIFLFLLPGKWKFSLKNKQIKIREDTILGFPNRHGDKTFSVLQFSLGSLDLIIAQKTV